MENTQILGYCLRKPPLLMAPIKTGSPAFSDVAPVVGTSGSQVSVFSPDKWVDLLCRRTGLISKHS